MMRQLVILFVLVLLMQVAERSGGTSRSSAFDSLTLVTTGFILIGAYAMGELFRRVRLPALLGYLGAGIIFGPKLAALVLGDPDKAPIGAEVLPQLSLANVMAVGVLGILGGGEIKLPELRENIGKLAAICGSVFVLVLPIVSAVVLGATFVLPGLVPFLSDVPFEHRLAGSLLFGALAVGMSPAATLALLQEVRAHGRFTSLVLGVVVLGDLVLVATFLVVLALAKLLVSPEGLTWARLIEQLPLIAAEFGWAIAIGVLVGLAYILYLRFVRVQLLLFSLAVIFVTSVVAAQLHAETLLAFLIGGFIVQNFSRHGHALVETFERISLPVFVIYFATQAAGLDLVSFTAYLPLTLVLVTVRCGLFVYGIGFGARRAGVTGVTLRQLQLSFFSQSGVDLVLAAMVAEAIPGWGVQIQTVTVATILIYVIGGPPLLARALDVMGESEAARERGSEGLQNRTQVPRLPAAVDARELIAPQNQDPVLRRRLQSLHQVITELREGLIGEQVLGRARRRHRLLRELAEEMANKVGSAGSSQLADTRIAEIDAAVVAGSVQYRSEPPTPFDNAALEKLLRTLETTQPFGEAHRVVRTPDLFEPAGGRVSRLLRAGRRFRRALFGPGHRSVPIGKLWRYHVSLEVPVVLWSQPQPVEADLWHTMLRHYRLTRAQLLAIANETWPDCDPTTGEPRDPAGVSFDGLEAWLAAAHEQARARAAALVESLSQCDDALRGGLFWGLAKAWAGFVGSVELAGTLEYPAWRYRPSSRYDLARAATAELVERGAADGARAAGSRDTLVALCAARHVARAIRVAAREFEERFSAILLELHGDFEQAKQSASVLIERPEAALDTGRTLVARLAHMSEHVDALRRHVSVLVDAEPAVVRRALRACPETVAPSLEAAVADGAGGVDTRRMTIRLRAWLSQTIVQNFEASRVVGHTEVSTGLGHLQQGLARISRVVEYHSSPDVVARGGHFDEGFGLRVAGLLEDAHEELRQLGEAAHTHLEEKIQAGEDASLGPIIERRWADISRRHRRIDENPRAAIVDWLRERQGAAQRQLSRLVRVADEELGALLSARPTRRAVESWRQVLLGARSAMPEPYQRLFVSLPAETMGSLIERPSLEELRALQKPSSDGRVGPILVHGERGAGKRTLIRQLYGGRVDSPHVHWLRLSPELEDERLVANALAPFFGLVDEEHRSFSGLRQRVLALPTSTWQPALETPAPTDAAAQSSRARRPVIVVENSERLFRRTPGGLARLQRFLTFIVATSEHASWIVLMADPAVRLLDAALELKARFVGRVCVPPLDAAELALLLETRHQLSGYGLRLQTGVPGLAVWLRRPRVAWGLWRGHPQSAFEHLAQLSGGNTRQAMRLWLALARLQPEDSSTVVVGPLPAEACSLIEPLSISTRLILAALLLLGSVSHRELAEMLDRSLPDVENDVTRLTNLGLVTVDVIGSRTLVACADTRLVQPLTAELRACNLL